MKFNKKIISSIIAGVLILSGCGASSVPTSITITADTPEGPRIIVGEDIQAGTIQEKVNVDGGRIYVKNPKDPDAVALGRCILIEQYDASGNVDPYQELPILEDGDILEINSECMNQIVSKNGVEEITITVK